MNNHDTIELLKECGCGIKNGVSNLTELVDRTESPALRKLLAQSISNHEELNSQVSRILSSSAQCAKEPPLMAKSMSWMKTEMKMAMFDTDSTVAALVTDGCGMGIKTLRQNLNDYPRASGEAKGIVQQVINEENSLVEAVAKYL